MTRVGGVAALAGGALFMVIGILMALRPPGVAGGPHRQTGDLAGVLLVAVLLILLGHRAVYTTLAGQGGRLGATAFGAAAIGAALATGSALWTAAGVDAAFFGLVLGVFAVCLGSILAGFAALGAAVTPRAPFVLLILGALALIVGFNTEDARALLTVPFGAAWAWLGWVFCAKLARP